MAAPGKILSMRRQLLGRILFVSQTLPKQQQGRKEEVESNYGTELDPAQLTAAQDHRCCTHNLYINKSLVPLKPLTRCQQLFCAASVQIQIDYKLENASVVINRLSPRGNETFPEFFIHTGVSP